ncbi:hypothetical protein COB55_05255 [Candidatus Wolfebacteria bacterium]|nr:MAG: hypothetical protein COB55_05255 [Candidatus Wolfebacteria bacterium]
MKLLNILSEKKIIPKHSIADIEEEIQAAGGDVRAVLEKRGVSEDDILKVQGEYYELPIRSLDGIKVPFEVLKHIPEESALHYRFAPIGINDGVLEIGIVDPDNAEARDVLNFVTSKSGLPFKIFLISEKDFNKVLETYKGLSGEVTKALSELETELVAEEDEPAGVTEGEDGAKIVEDAPVTKMVATILHYAVEGLASDVHIEHMGEQVRVRFRVDGLLHVSLILPTKVHRAVVARIKILASMRLDEKRKPQDGRFSAKILGRKIDFRVSTFPAYYGEKVVMRILDAERGVRTLDDIGVSKDHMDVIRKAVERPHGLVLISGPTGSGKSTTLYAMLRELDHEKYNILSLEDPVEFNIPGISQSQVHPDIGYTFASGLRTTLRQDPDVIMVGEIRDKETAKLAVQAALTGHLVLSTIHTNDAAGVIPRLINMGVDPFLIAPTLVLAIAQRLVRKICEGSEKKIPVEGSIKVMLEKQFEDLPEQFRKKIPKFTSVHEAQPTKACPSGVRGRMAVMEMFEMDKDLESTILTTPTNNEIMKILRKKGMITLKEDAIIKSVEGKISFEEVNKL